MRIFLTGFMGSGKTHWGRAWSEVSGFTFIDLDELIEMQESKTIDAIFGEKGEAYFREVETAALLKTENFDNCIIACGGGTPCFGNNLKLMKQLGKTVYLKASPELIMNNLQDELKKRPLLKNVDEDELLNFITVNLAERSVFYESSDIVAETPHLDVHFIFTIINQEYNS